MKKLITLLLFSVLIFSCDKDDEIYTANDETNAEQLIVEERGNKVKVCHHKPNGKWKIKKVKQSKLAQHLAHGDIILDEDGDGYYKSSPCTVLDCDDSDPAIHPEAEEVDNGVDDDCDGVVDGGGVLSTYYLDSDQDGYGDPNNSVQDYSPPQGYVDNNEDCDDNDPNVYPGALELNDGVDNDCDGVIDGGVQFTFYLDNDLDGYGDANNSIQAYIAPSGYVDDHTDCNDEDASVYPGAIETWYDGIDQNCDGLNDYDQDGDSYVDDGYPGEASGTAPNAGDCDDTDALINPGEAEICDNEIDNDCDGKTNCLDDDCWGDQICNAMYITYPNDCGITEPWFQNLVPFSNAYDYSATVGEGEYDPNNPLFDYTKAAKIRFNNPIPLGGGDELYTNTFVHVYEFYYPNTNITRVEFHMFELPLEIFSEGQITVSQTFTGDTFGTITCIYESALAAGIYAGVE